ncbi:MAG TPA: DUF3306 domain-containing protein [Acetobacteraceae bacterium]|nr:DUF3306 domain-containing protein [Acetobacteraceae bacterium]
MSGEGFLSRWSRRKRGEEVAEPEPAPAPPAEPVPEAAPLPPAPVAQEAAPSETEEAFDLSALPKVEELTATSDISGFMRPGVPAWLRTAALRRIWSLDPEIRSFVGPADYAWDYNAPDGVPGFALELGGDVKRLLAQAIGAEEEKPERPPEEPPAEAEVTVAELAPEPEATPEPPAMPAPEAELPAPEDPAPLPRRRHGGAMPA